MCCLMTKMDALRLIILQMEHISLALIMMTGLHGSYRNCSPVMPITGSPVFDIIQAAFANSCKILRDGVFYIGIYDNGGLKIAGF